MNSHSLDKSDKVLLRILHEEEVNGDQMKVDFPGTEAVGFTSHQLY